LALPARSVSSPSPSPPSRGRRPGPLASLPPAPPVPRPPRPYAAPAAPLRLDLPPGDLRPTRANVGAPRGETVGTGDRTFCPQVPGAPALKSWGLLRSSPRASGSQVPGRPAGRPALRRRRRLVAWSPAAGPGRLPLVVRVPCPRLSLPTRTCRERGGRGVETSTETDNVLVRWGFVWLVESSLLWIDGHGSQTGDRTAGHHRTRRPRRPRRDANAHPSTRDGSGGDGRGRRHVLGRPEPMRVLIARCELLPGGCRRLERQSAAWFTRVCDWDEAL
jgi:hypothetical protein